MSMGGLASQAWAEAVNALYEQGVFIVTAAGNNFGNLPTRNIVYPARFNRVVAACGVMADHTPYADLGLDRMAGNYGPDSKMATAIAASTPNTPWAKLGCPMIVDLRRRRHVGGDAAGRRRSGDLDPGQHARRSPLIRKAWMRVEAIRKALFGSASLSATQDRSTWAGASCAPTARSDQAPVHSAELRAEEPDSASFAILRLLTGLGMPPRPIRASGCWSSRRCNFRSRPRSRRSCRTRRRRPRRSRPRTCSSSPKRWPPTRKHRGRCARRWGPAYDVRSARWRLP